MAEDKTTIILVLLAGDEETTLSLDPLLKGVQDGIGGLPVGEHPYVYCMYYRWLSRRWFPWSPVTTKHFQLFENTLAFTAIGRLIESQYHPTLLGPNLWGGLSSQLTQFISQVAARPEQKGNQGPIRLIFGAHGDPGKGLKPLSRLLLHLSVLWLFLKGAMQSQSWLEQFEVLKRRLAWRPARFASRSLFSRRDLTLDQAATALLQLPQHRLHTLIMHTCYLSAIETIAALQNVPHHIGCATQLARHMRLWGWFRVFNDSLATDVQLTTACFTDLSTTNSNAEGLFSSHRTDSSLALLGVIDDLGNELLTSMAASHPHTESEIQCAQDISGYAAGTVDLKRFCEGLRNLTPAVQAVLDELVRTQFQIDRIDTTTADPLNYRDHQGISIVLPVRYAGASISSLLPSCFRKFAQGWCDFIDVWGT